MVPGSWPDPGRAVHLRTAIPVAVKAPRVAVPPPPRLRQTAPASALPGRVCRMCRYWGLLSRRRRRRLYNSAPSILGCSSSRCSISRLVNAPVRALAPGTESMSATASARFSKAAVPLRSAKASWRRATSSCSSRSPLFALLHRRHAPVRLCQSVGAAVHLRCDVVDGAASAAAVGARVAPQCAPPCLHGRLCRLDEPLVEACPHPGRELLLSLQHGVSDPFCPTASMRWTISWASPRVPAPQSRPCS